VIEAVSATCYWTCDAVYIRYKYVAVSKDSVVMYLCKYK